MFLGNKAGSTEIENQLYNHKQSIKWGPFYVLYAIIKESNLTAGIQAGMLPLHQIINDICNLS